MTRRKTLTEALPLIICSCGAEIILIPNVKRMSEAIEVHVKEHVRTLKASKDAEAEADSIRDDLIAKILNNACEL